MSDWGMKLAQSGQNVKTAGDADLVYSSSWPTLKVITSFQKTFTTNGSGTFEVIYDHYLGYVPAFIPYSYETASGKFYFLRTNVFLDKNHVYFVGPPSQTEFTLGLIIFALDIETDYQAPIVGTSTDPAGGVDKSYGIKIAKEGANIRSHDLRDYLIHSGTRGPMIHSVKHATFTSSTTYTYTHDLSYNPIFLVYDESGQPGAYGLANNLANLTTSGKNINLAGTTGYQYSIVILKDPFNVVNNVREITI